MSAFTSRFIAAEDGLRLHTRDYGEAEPDAPTIVCLPGLARTSEDFDPLARALVAADARRRVIVLDYRGRGLSARDPNPDNYDLPVESRDILAVLDALGVGRAVFVGTSRGGLHTMIIAAVRPTLLRGVVLNDIGPVLEPVGLTRIRGYVGKLPRPTSWAEAVDLLKGVAATQFTDFADADWLAYARTTFEERDGAIVTRYDPALMHNLAKLDLSALPTLWPQFDALAAVPVLVIRGANSDLLSPATVAEMTRRHPDCASFEIPAQGHAPMLVDAPTLAAITAFVARCEARITDAARIDSGLALLS